MKGTCSILLLTACLIGGTATANQVVEGETGRGAKYMLAVPDNWNGDLVIYAHGYVDTFMPIQLPTLDEIGLIKDMMLSNGYVVAYSSYSAYGFSVEEGVLDTQQLYPLFVKHFEELWEMMFETLMPEFEKMEQDAKM